jgi:hypothetical protein
VKYKKVPIPAMAKKIEPKDVTAKDVLMVRVTIEFPVLKNNFGNETVGTHLECAAGDLMYPDKDNSKSDSWISIETSDVTLKELKAYATSTNSHYLYDATSEDDIDINEMKK